MYISVVIDTHYILVPSSTCEKTNFVSRIGVPAKTKRILAVTGTAMIRAAAHVQHPTYRVTYLSTHPPTHRVQQHSFNYSGTSVDSRQICCCIEFGFSCITNPRNIGDLRPSGDLRATSERYIYRCGCLRRRFRILLDV